MIKFFRKIRQSLLAENKFSKYLLYAIGEIFLVFIGIAMALQFNNWNEAKKTKEKEKQVLTEILSDLNYNIQDLNNLMYKNTNNLKRNIYSIRTIIGVLQSNQEYHDSIGFHFRSVNSFDLADYKTSGFQSLTSIGMDLIEDPRIRSAIGGFYTSSITETQSAFNEVRDDFYSYMLDYYRKDFTDIFEGPLKNSLRPNDFQALKNNDEYIQSLRAYLNVNEFYFIKVGETLNKANQLQEDIKNYIN